jgi:hypothetical protein
VTTDYFGERFRAYWELPLEVRFLFVRWGRSDLQGVQAMASASMSEMGVRCGNMILDLDSESKL